MQKPPFKLGISIGPMKGQKEFSTDIEHPPFAVNQANRYIKENYGEGFELFCVDHKSPNRRKTRRRRCD